MEIKSLENTDHDDLFEAFGQAFAGYEVQLDKAEHLKMLKRRGFDPRLSFAAFDGGRIVSFTCNGTGDFYGTPTAYDTGTGTLAEYRGRGLASRIFGHSIPYLKKAGVRQYLLEVLQHNSAAVSVYRKAGFEVTREFYYFKAESPRIDLKTKPAVFPFAVKEIDMPEYASLSAFWDFKPSWQNSPEAINRTRGDFICIGGFMRNTLVGYAVFEPAGGDVAQIAVNRRYRRKGLGSALFREMLAANRYGSIKIVNGDIGCDSLTSFLAAMDIGPTGKQFEMVKEL